MSFHWLHMRPDDLFSAYYKNIIDWPRGLVCHFHLYIFFFVGGKMQLLIPPGQAKPSTPNLTINLTRTATGWDMDRDPAAIKDIVFMMIQPGISAGSWKGVQFIDYAHDRWEPGELVKGGTEGGKSRQFAVNISLDPNAVLPAGGQVVVNDMFGIPQTWTLAGQPLERDQTYELARTGQLHDDLNEEYLKRAFHTRNRCTKIHILVTPDRALNDNDLRDFVSNALRVMLATKIYEGLGAAVKDPVYVAVQPGGGGQGFYIFWQQEDDQSGYVCEGAILDATGTGLPIVGQLSPRTGTAALLNGISRETFASMIDGTGRLDASWNKLAS